MTATSDVMRTFDGFAREMQFRRTDVARVAAFGERAVFVPTDGLGAQMGGAMATGMAAGLGVERK